MEPTSPNEVRSDLSLPGCLLGISSMGFGNAALVFAAIHVVQAENVAVSSASSVEPVA